MSDAQIHSEPARPTHNHKPNTHLPLEMPHTSNTSTSDTRIPSEPSRPTLNHTSNTHLHSEQPIAACASTPTSAARTPWRRPRVGMTGYRLDNPTITSALEEELMEWGEVCAHLERPPTTPSNPERDKSYRMGRCDSLEQPMSPFLPYLRRQPQTHDTGKRSEATHQNPQHHLVCRN